MSARKILLGLSFFNQTGEVTETLKTFLALLLNSPYEVVLGLENEKSRTQVVPVLRSLQSQGWATCYIWDDDVNRSAIQLLDRTSAMPFFENFSYGAAVNRMLLLAIASGCEYLVRVDPGAGCPANMVQLVDWHTKAISQGKRVVSGQYSNRLAIRDDFVERTQRDRVEKYYTLVHEATGIDCRPAEPPEKGQKRHRGQITGGAAMTLSLEGPPAIVFDNVRVWASDDGFFEMFLGANRTDVQNEIKVQRSEPGFGLQLSAYVARVAAMVVLRHAHQGSESGVALQKARQFLQDIGEFASPGYSYDPAEAERLITPQVGAIYSGYQNYLKLVEQWPVTAHQLVDRLSKSTLRAW